MSYKLGAVPSPKATFEEKADFLEVKCVKSETLMYSIQDAASALGIVMDEGDVDKVAEEIPFFEELRVIDDRNKQCGGNYPFTTLSNLWGLSVSHENQIVQSVYTFLLLATRNDMGRNRIKDDIDGGMLFERLCSIVLKSYFGENCQSFVFGTGDESHSTFKDRLQYLLERVKEPKTSLITTREGIEYTKDDALDVVVNIPFDDKRTSQFMAFCQCKTGDSWMSSISQLSPSHFAKCYFNPPLQFTPILVHMVSESFETDWYHRTGEVLFFDRCRIMRYLPSEETITAADANLLNEIQKWNEAVLRELE